MSTAISSKSRTTLRSLGIAACWAVLMGMLSGLVCVAVRIGLHFLQWAFMRDTRLLPIAAANLTPLHRAVIPVAGALLATLVKVAARPWSGEQHAVEYVEAVRLDDGRIPFASAAWRILSSAFSIASGAAIGREGSMIQFAAAVDSWCARRFESRTLSLARKISYGAAGAVAAVYQAPIAGVFFVFEIVLGDWTWRELPPLLLASAAGWWISKLLLGGGPLFAVPGTLPYAGLLWTLPLAIVLGVASPAYQKLLRVAVQAKRLPLAMLWSGVAVGLLSVVKPQVWGNGDVALSQAISGSPLLMGVLAVLSLRLIAVAACVGTGTIGGVFTPTLYTGAALGLLAAHLVHAPQPLLLLVIGMGAFLAGVTHAPWMATFMAVELTGQWHLWPLLAVINLLARFIAERISSDSLYAVATPTPIHASASQK